MARAIYSSHPIARYAIGRFKFENTVLDFNKQPYDSDKDEAEFKKIYDSLPPIEQNRIKLLDVSAAEDFAKRVIAQQALVTRVTDSSHGRDPREVGTGSLETAQTLPGERIDNQGDPIDPTILKAVPETPGTISGHSRNNEIPAGTGDNNSGENHGAGNMTGIDEGKTPEELAKQLADESSGSAADKKAAADLVAEEQAKAAADSKPSAEEVKSTLGLKGLNKTK